MSILADESIDRQIVKFLRNNNFNVDYIAEMDPGITDREVIQSAQQKGYILLTADKDFGELLYRQKFPITSVILIRLAGVKPNDKAIIVTNAIKKHYFDIGDSIMVISSNSVRIRQIRR